MNKNCPECGQSLIETPLADMVPADAEASDLAIQAWFCSEGCRDDYLDRKGGQDGA